MQVSPSDFIFGDYDGVLVIPGHLTLEVLQECERVMGIEDAARGTSPGATIRSRCSRVTSACKPGRGPAGPPPGSGPAGKSARAQLTGGAAFSRFVLKSANCASGPR